MDQNIVFSVFCLLIVIELGISISPSRIADVLQPEPLLSKESDSGVQSNSSNSNGGNSGSAPKADPKVSPSPKAPPFQDDKGGGDLPNGGVPKPAAVANNFGNEIQSNSTNSNGGNSGSAPKADPKVSPSPKAPPFQDDKGGGDLPNGGVPKPAAVANNFGNEIQSNSTNSNGGNSGSAPKADPKVSPSPKAPPFQDDKGGGDLPNGGVPKPAARA